MAKFQTSNFKFQTKQAVRMAKFQTSNFNFRANESRMKLASIMPSAAENHVNKP